MNSSYSIEQINFKFGQWNLKTITMKSFVNREFSLNGVAWRPFFIFCHQVVTQIYIVQSVPYFTFDKSPSLKTSTCQCSVIVIAPPTDNRKSALCDKDHLIYVIFTWRGLHMISSNITYSVCSLAPHSGHRK